MKRKSETAVSDLPSAPKSILKKPKTEKSPKVKTGKHDGKKPQLKKLKGEPTVEGKPKKSVVISQSPTKGLGKKPFKKNFKNKNADENVEPLKSKATNGEASPKGKSKKSFVKSQSSPKFSGKKSFENSNKKNFNNKGTEEKKEAQPVDKKEARKKQKLLRSERREKERGYVLPGESKKIFEELRCSKCPTERRKELASKLFKVLKGKFVNSARSHELSRMTQWVLKLGTPEIRIIVIGELMSEIVALSKLKYANHIVQCMMQDCGQKVRQKMLEQFLGHINELLKNKFSAPIIEEFYSKFAKNSNKVLMKQELFSDLFRGARNQSYTSLSEVLTQNPTLKSAILKSTKIILSKLIDKPYALGTNIVTDVLFDYLQNCEDQDKLDIMEVLKTNIHVLLKTKSGNQLMMLLMWESTPKVKKQMVKELKAEVLTIAKSDGNIFLRSLFDSVDDTVLIKKAILPTILDNAEELIKDNNGKKVILYLVAHRDTSFFHPKELEKLKQADESSFVKKDISLKEKELIAPCLDALLDKIKENPKFWLSDGKIGLVAQAILSKGSGEKLEETYNAICTYIVECVNAGNLHPVEDPGLHVVLKKMLKNSPADENTVSFAECFITKCDFEIIKKLFSINRGCFLLVSALESESDSVLSHLKDVLDGENVAKILKKLTYVGAQILLKHLKEKNIQ